MNLPILTPAGRALAVFCSLAAPLGAEVTLNPVFSDGAVLQRGVVVPVWGTAEPGETVTVTFAGASVAATACGEGRWRADLAPMEASAESRELVAAGSSTVTVRDVVVGDVWLASGQSNMDSPLRSGSAAQALPEAADPLVRFFRVKKAVSVEPARAVAGGSWVASTPDSARDFSAVAWFFAREVRRTQGVPVGILQSSWGGTPIKTWMSLASLRADPPIGATLAEWDAALKRHLEVRDQPGLMEAYYADQADWDANVNPAWREARRIHDEEMAALRAAGQPTRPSPQPSRPEPQMPDPMAFPAPSKRPQTPTITWNAMIAPLAPYALKGFLWYQGEADGSKGIEYRAWLPRLITGWRADFAGGPDQAFLIVQLPSNGRDTEPVATGGWPFLREAQARATALPKVGIAVTLDIGNPKDVHPDNKVHVGTRLALVGRHVAYGEDLAWTGPTYREHAIEGGAIRLRFDHVGGGLAIGTAPWVPEGATPLPTDRLLGFYVAGKDRRWREATATIDGDTVLVSHPDIAEPVAVRYGWANSPRVNLANAEGLPAAPFRTDDWLR